MDDRLLAFAICRYLPPSLTCCLLNRIFDFPAPIIFAVAVSVILLLLFRLMLLSLFRLMLLFRLLLLLLLLEMVILYEQQARLLVQLPCKDWVNKTMND